MAEKSLSKDSSVSLSPGPVTEKKETLAARARRFIGRPLLEDHSESNSPPRESVNKGRGIKKSPTRRRQQVLQAQRTHRQRTQGYIRELEKEVLRLRENEMALELSNKTLQERINMLEPLAIANGTFSRDHNIKEFLHQHKLNQQPYLNTPSSSGGGQSLHGDAHSIIAGNDPFVNVDLTALGTTRATYGCSTKAAMESPVPFQPPNRDAPELATWDPSGAASERLVPSVITPQRAVDFVLDLERPCLAHIKYRYLHDYKFNQRKYPKFDAGPGHVFMATTSLVNSSYASDPSTQPFQVPPADIDKLFQTSLNLDLGDEVTPIQIWENIKRISRLYVLDEEVVRALQGEFRKYARCNSFGAVVERETVSKVFGFYLEGFEMGWV
ncbi:hypothetical protein EJ08DRAFT_700458 [Tothia fuscella]|uniref:BZIP domain-containing protein n=1 Tax=Tothia fuscella TaxID=1048955 RepID=A0A9P4NKC2_9PEZI|nr:hypothetical protein EJ08DRAFT_700458 [Tothia fuscella]